MQIGAMDSEWSELPFKHRIRRIAELGFKGVQLWMTTAELGFDIPLTWFPPAWTPQRSSLSPKELVDLTRDVGLEITAMGPHYVLGEPPRFWGETGWSRFTTARGKEERLKDIKNLIEYTAHMDVKNLALFSGGSPNEIEYWPCLVDMMRELADEAEKAGVVLAVENMPQLLVKDEDDLLRLIREVESDAVRVMFDPKNLNDAPPGRRDIPAAVRKLKGYIVHTHVGDSIYGGYEFGKNSQGKWIVPVPGKGEVPFPRYLEALKEIGYDGWLVVEYAGDARGLEPGMIESKEYIEKLLKSIF